jgi:hypothetical protein
MFEIEQDMDGYYTSYKLDPRFPDLGPVGNRRVSPEYKAQLDVWCDIIGTYPRHSAAEAAKAGVKLWVHSEPCAERGHIGIKTLANDCYFCEKRKSEPNPRAEARKQYLNWYVPLEPCEYCGTKAKRDVARNTCSGCRDLRRAEQAATPASPRQAAIATNQTTYIPLEPCPRCGLKAPKRVENSKCSGCRPRKATDDRRSPDSIMMESEPYLIISKVQAVALGLKVYRTGRECNRGHTGYRYVSTNNCITCMRGK